MDSKITCSNCGWSWKHLNHLKLIYIIVITGAKQCPAKQEEESNKNGKKLIPKEEETGWLDKIDNVLSVLQEQPLMILTLLVQEKLHLNMKILLQVWSGAIWKQRPKTLTTSFNMR
jgi:hypothetical protein